ncbi:MAG: HAD-IIA family hydrolase [Candidatus Hadarchaeales archaeon]
MPEAFEGVSAVILDMDGVLYRGEVPVDGAADAVKEIRRKGLKILFLTNNSTLSRADYVKKLRKMGIEAEKEEIITSGFVAALYLKKNFPSARVFAVGGKGLFEELREAGVKLLGIEEAGKATHVVVGLDQNLTYEKIKAAVRAILNGADFIATNSDPTYPTEDGLAPGAGAVIGALEGSTGARPRLIFGKPALTMVKIAVRRFGVKRGEVAMVGDRLDTDVAVGKKLGLRTILVLTGVAKREDVRRAKEKPDFVFESLKEAVFG